MASDHYGPSLDVLVSPRQIVDNQCVWRVKKSGKTTLEQCGHHVSKVDIELRTKSVTRLGYLISYDSGTTKWIYSDVTAVYEKLEEISRWMLCKSARHRKHSSIIYETWIEQLGEPTPTETKVDRNHLALNDKPTEGQIRQALGIDHIERLKCLCCTPQCKNAISIKSKTRATEIVGQLARAGSVTQDVEHSLLDLAERLLCRGYHQAKASTIQAVWIRKIKELFAPKEAASQLPSTPCRHRRTVADSETPDSDLSTGGSSPISIGTITPATSPSIDRIGRPKIPSAASPLSAKHVKEVVVESTVANTTEQDEDETREGKKYLQHNRLTRKTTLEREQGYLSPLPPSFEVYTPLKTEEAMAKLMNKLTTDLLISETKDGYIYGYRRSSSSSHIKIGVSEDVEKRMKKWSQQCKYEPEIVFKLMLPNAMKVERLIHICLHQERRRENAGTCNSGSGCPKGHIEWFEITLSRLKDVAAAWQRWIEMKPYDEKGSLKQEWKTHIKSVILNGLPNSWRQWIEFPSVKEELRAETKLDAKVENIFGLDFEDKKGPTFNKEAKSGVVITETEIKDEPEEDDTALRERDLSAISRQFTQRLERLTDTVKAEEGMANNASLVAVVA